MLHRLWNNFYFLIGVTMLIWGTTASVATYLFKEALTAGEVTTFDILFAFGSLLVITLLRPESRRSLARYRASHVPKLMVCSLLGIFLYNYLMFRAYSSDPQNVTPYAIINYMWPLTTIVFGVVILRERPTVYTWVGAGVGFAGFALIQLAKSFSASAVQDAWASGDAGGVLRSLVSTTFGDASAAGCLMALAAAIMWGIFGPLARKWTERERFDPLSSMMLFCGIGAVLALAVFGPRIRWGLILGRWDYLVAFAWVGVLAHGVANVLWLRTIAVGGAGRTGVVAYLTPVMALGYLALFHRQVPSLASGLGLGLILLAVALAESHRSRQARINGRTPRAGEKPPRE